jgi:hypothetical protein
MCARQLGTNAQLRGLFAAVLVWACTVSTALASDPGIISRIPRRPVESTALANVGYSKRLRVLEIEFKRGGTYRYVDVPPEVHRQLLVAESKAGFYNRHIRGKYDSVYVRPRQKR